MALFDNVTCHKFGPSLTITMDGGNQYLEKKIIFMSTNLQCHMLDFIRWMTINNVNMISWMQL